jgi:hypothetical protein
VREQELQDILASIDFCKLVPLNRPSSSSSSLVLDALKGGSGEESTQDASATTATHTITPSSAVARWWSVG